MGFLLELLMGAMGELLGSCIYSILKAVVGGWVLGRVWSLDVESMVPTELWDAGEALTKVGGKAAALAFKRCRPFHLPQAVRRYARPRRRPSCGRKIGGRARSAGTGGGLGAAQAPGKAACAWTQFLAWLAGQELPPAAGRIVLQLRARRRMLGIEKQPVRGGMIWGVVADGQVRWHWTRKNRA